MVSLVDIISGAVPVILHPLTPHMSPVQGKLSQPIFQWAGVDALCQEQGQHYATSITSLR